MIASEPVSGACGLPAKEMVKVCCRDFGKCLHPCTPRGIEIGKRASETQLLWLLAELNERQDVRGSGDRPVPNEVLSLLIEFDAKFPGAMKMSFDEQPAANPHSKCAAEIHRLEKRNTVLRNTLIHATSALSVINLYPEHRSRHTMTVECKCKEILNQGIDAASEPGGAEELLRELVACKDLKERIAVMHGGMIPGWQKFQEEYERRQPLAWVAARAYLGAGR